MNNDLNNLYGNNTNNNDTSISNSNNTSSNQTNNAQDLSSLYGNTTSMQVEEQNQNNEPTNNDLHVDQAGLSMLYHNNEKTLDEEVAEPPKEETKITSEPIPQPTVSTVPLHISDTDLLEAYVGKNFEKIATHPVNFSAMFFTYIYMFYRKEYLLGIIFYVLYLVLSLFMNDTIVAIGLSIIAGVAFNTYYIAKAKLKISKIKQKHPTTPINEIKDICAKKGGRRILNIFLFIIISILITAIMNIHIIGSNIKTTQSSFGINDFVNTIRQEINELVNIIKQKHQ